MYVKEELKLNKFRDVAIPSGREYFRRYGLLQTPGSQYTGDEVAIMPQSKVASMVEYQRYLDEHAPEQTIPDEDQE